MTFVLLFVENYTIQDYSVWPRTSSNPADIYRFLSHPELYLLKKKGMVHEGNCNGSDTSGNDYRVATILRFLNRTLLLQKLPCKV